MRPQSLGELLGKLEKKGYITREPLESDRRVMVIKLTEAGTTAAETSQQEEDPIFNNLTMEEKESFSLILEKMTTALEATLPEEERSFKGYPDRGHRYRGRGHGFGGRYDRMNEDFDSRKNIAIVSNTKKILVTANHFVIVIMLNSIGNIAKNNR